MFCMPMCVLQHPPIQLSLKPAQASGRHCTCSPGSGIDSTSSRLTAGTGSGVRLQPAHASRNRERCRVCTGPLFTAASKPAPNQTVRIVVRRHIFFMCCSPWVVTLSLRPDHRSTFVVCSCCTPVDVTAPSCMTSTTLFESILVRQLAMTCTAKQEFGQVLTYVR